MQIEFDIESIESERTKLSDWPNVRMSNKLKIIKQINDDNY